MSGIPQNTNQTVPITTRLTPFFWSFPCKAFLASSKTFSRAIVIFGSGSSTCGSVSSRVFKFKADISSCLVSAARAGAVVPAFFVPLPEAFFGVEGADDSCDPNSAAFFCCASLSAFSRSLAAKYIDTTPSVHDQADNLRVGKTGRA